MRKYNKYINNFANNAEYEAYINGSVAEVPNTALIDDIGKMIYSKILPNNYVMFGTTTGTQDFMIGQSSSQYSDADCIQIHVVVEDDSGINKMYVAPEDVLKIPKYFYSDSSGFANTEILSIKKWKINTSNVTDMQNMFRSCENLTNLDLSNFDTSNVTDMSDMFNNCSKLTTLDLSNFDTRNVEYINSMFVDCSKLTTLNLSSFDTSKVLGMNRTFYGCENINKLYLSSSFFNSTSITNYYFSNLFKWTDTESLSMFVEAITEHDGNGKRVSLSSSTKDALTTEQKTAITNAGWTIS